MATTEITKRRSLECIFPPIRVHRQTDRQTDTQTDTQTDRSTNLIISSNSLRPISGDKETAKF